MAIWHKAYTVDEVRRRGVNTMITHLGIEITEVGADSLAGTMPVDERTKQPAGLLHGGASAALAESLASTAANMVVDPERQMCVGLEINANHVRPVRDGIVTGKSTPLHLGRTTQVWQTEIRQGGKLVCVSRMTLAVIRRHDPPRRAPQG